MDDSFNWAHFLAVACELIDIEAGLKSSVEAKERVAISRAYYAAFHKARLHLKEKENDPNIPREAVHAYVIKKFAEYGESKHAEVAQRLRRLRTSREKADYEAAYGNVAKNARLAIKESIEIIALLKNLPN